MFVSFTVQNAFSFYEAQTLDARAVKTCKERREEATFKPFASHDNRLVKTLAIYGANASGKSNIFYALADMQRTVLTSAAESQSGDRLNVMPFLFSEESAIAPSSYTLEFVIGDIQYKYGYSATAESVVGEYLVRKGARGRTYKEVFSRDVSDGRNRIVCDKSFGADELVISKTRRNALFLSTCAMLAVPEAERIVDYFAHRLKVIPADRMTANFTSKMLVDGRHHDEIVRFLKMTDPGIGSVSVLPFKKETGRMLPDGTRETTMGYEPQVHPVLKDGSVSARAFPLMAVASLGTAKAFSLAAHVFDSLETGSVLMLDELDSRLHPLLTKEIIRLFNNAETNPRNAQLVFNTHDTNLLGVRVYDEATGRRVYLLRRDEIYFVEKNGEMCSKIYSLVDFKKDGLSVRKDASYEKDYLSGLYGAIPYIGRL